MAYYKIKSVFGSILLVASSIRTILDFLSRERIIQISYFSPAERFPPDPEIYPSSPIVLIFLVKGTSSNAFYICSAESFSSGSRFFLKDPP